ncbi:MAG: glycosyltransferase family 1 protein [Bacteroidetes bacterium]|nr:glycosyltransferase family 1 protein [Bacteroidota bacterium]
MRVCLDIRVQTKGGTSTFISNFVHELISKNISHDFVFLTNEDGSIINSSDYETIKVPNLHPLLELTWIQTKLPMLIKKRRIRLYHSLKHLGPIYCPVNSIYRNAAVGQFAGIYPLSFQEKIYWIWLEKLLFSKADLIIAVSNYIRTFLINHLNISADKIITVYNGCDEYFRSLPADKIPTDYLSTKGIEQPFILCVGNVVPVKNHKVLIKAFKTLKKDKTFAQQILVIAGGTYHPHFQELKKLVVELGLEKSIKFIGQQSKQELLYLYNSAEMLVHPSLHEGFSFTILEAMACGLPIVCSNTTSNPEAAGEAAIYYDNPNDPEELANSILTLRQSSALRNNLSRKAKKQVSQFTWSKCVQDTVSVYDRFN